jgi:arylsulfatase A-like enzyme
MSSNDAIHREVLPLPDHKPLGLTTYEARNPDTTLLILLHGMRFGAASVFGGLCHTPTTERLAAAGLKYARFHTTAPCSPTRAALWSRRKHHAVGMGGIAEMATSAPGYASLRPNTCAPLAEIFELNGYSTAQFGKYYDVPIFDSTPIEPFQHWPIGSGFGQLCGFIGRTNQWYPALYDGATPIEVERTPAERYQLM